MARIPLPTVDQLTPEQRRVYDAIVGLRGGHLPTPYRASLHSPELTDKWQQLGELLRYRTTLPLRLSELAILVVARHFDGQYVWHFHAPAALKGGIAADAVDAIRDGRRPELSKPDEQAVYDYSRELVETRFVADATYARTLDALGVQGIVELTALLGYYVMVAMSLNAHALPLPDGATPALPPRQR